MILTGRNPERLERAARDVGAASTAAFDADDPAALKALLRRACRADRPRADHRRRPALQADARDGRGGGARRARRATSVAGARGRPRRARGQDAPRRLAAADGRHRRPADPPRPRDRLRGHRRAAPAHREPRARARAGPGQPDRRRVRRHPAVGIAAGRSARGAPRASCARRCRSGASSARPTSRRSPST